MSAPTTTRRDMLRLGTSAAAYAAGAAIVTGGIALAGEAKGATPGVSPALLALIATVERREARQRAFAQRVYDPATARFQAADQATPHVEIDASHGATWSTADHMRVANARLWTSKDRALSTQEQRKHFNAMQRLVVAYDKRQIEVDRLGDRERLSRASKLDDEIGDRMVTALIAVEAFEPASLADLHAKLAFVVPRGWLGDDGAPERLLADVARLSDREA